MADGTTDPTESPPVTTKQRRKAWERELRKVAEQHAALRALERRRARLFLEGRNLNPPVTFAEMARIAGVTQAAVIQAAKREEARDT